MLAVPRFNLEYDGGMAADDVARAGFDCVVVEGVASDNALRNELTSAFVRILSGTSSRMVENVSRWSIRLQHKSPLASRHSVSPYDVNHLEVEKLLFL